MQVDPIPLEELIASSVELRDGHGKANTIIRSVMAIVSMVASSILILMILRSRTRLSTTYHRILLGMAIADVSLSLSLALFNFTAPSDDDYLVWNARGNQGTCSALGFVYFMGAGSGLLYNCSINVYSLAVVKYEKSDEYIRTKIEPFLHGFPIVYSLVCSITSVVKKNLNNNGGGICYAPVYKPPHCTGYEDGQIREGFVIPCGRGRDGAVLFSYVTILITTLIVPLIVGISLGMIYQAVLQHEKKMARHGSRSYRDSVQQSIAGNANEGDRRSSMRSSIRTLVSSLDLRRSVGQSPSTPNQNQSNSHAVLQRALAYSIAYFLAWSFSIINVCLDIANKKRPTSIWYLSSIFNPLQGLFNFLIFMYPKVTIIKSRGEDNISWCRAFAEAFWSMVERN